MAPQPQPRTIQTPWGSFTPAVDLAPLVYLLVLYGLVYGVHMGVGGPKKDMAVLMTLNNNGQAITLSRKLADQGAMVVLNGRDATTLAARQSDIEAAGGRAAIAGAGIPCGSSACGPELQRSSRSLLANSWFCSRQ